MSVCIHSEANIVILACALKKDVQEREGKSLEPKASTGKYREVLKARKEITLNAGSEDEIGCDTKYLLSEQRELILYMISELFCCDAFVEI